MVHWCLKLMLTFGLVNHSLNAIDCQVDLHGTDKLQHGSQHH